MAGKFSVYISPDPVPDNLLNLRITNASATTVSVSIIDMQGTILITQNLLLNTVSLNQSVDVSALSKGVYILKVVNNNNERQQMKVVKGK